MSIYDPIAIALDLPPISHAKINRAVKKHEHSSVNFDTTGTKNGFYGRKHTEETLQKMRKPKEDVTRMRYPKSVSHRNNIRKAVTGRAWYNDGKHDYMCHPGDIRIEKMSLVKGCLRMIEQNKRVKRKSLQALPPSRCSSQSY